MNDAAYNNRTAGVQPANRASVGTNRVIAIAVNSAETTSQLRRWKYLFIYNPKMITIIKGDLFPVIYFRNAIIRGGLFMRLLILISAFFFVANGYPAWAAAPTCNASAEGTMVYDDANNIMVFCDGVKWVAMGGSFGGGGGTDPLAGLGCSAGQVVSWDGSDWACVAQSGLWTNSGSGYLEYSAVDTGVKLNKIAGMAAPTVTLADLGCATNQILKWNGTAWACAADASGGAPALPSAQIFVGNGSNVATAVAMSGGATLSNAGVLTIAANSVGTNEIVNNTVAPVDTSFVGTLTEGKWCTVSGGDIVCTSDAPGGGGGAVRQQFSSSGTWTKPGSGTVAFVQVWGGGAGGARSSCGAGGGGGGYSESWIPLSSLGATVSVTVGAGGAGLSVNANGNNGGDSTFGTLVGARGGKAGSDTTVPLPAGGSPFNPSTSSEITPNVIFTGGAGSVDQDGSCFTFKATASFWGGGGGGNSHNNGLYNARIGGGSVNGGAGGSSTGAVGSPGAVPGGGGAGGTSTSGAGGNGQVIVTVF